MTCLNCRVGMKRRASQNLYLPETPRHSGFNTYLVLLSMQPQLAGGAWVWGQCELPIRFQASMGYIVRACLNVPPQNSSWKMEKPQWNYSPFKMCTWKSINPFKKSSASMIKCFWELETLKSCSSYFSTGSNNCFISHHPGEGCLRVQPRTASNFCQEYWIPRTWEPRQGSGYLNSSWLISVGWVSPVLEAPGILEYPQCSFHRKQVFLSALPCSALLQGTWAL